MKKNKHSESSMVNAVQRLEAAERVADLCRDYSIGKTTLYKWRSLYSGMEVSQVKRLKELEEENRRLKKMYAELSIDHEILKEVLEKKSRARGKGRACWTDGSRTQNQHHSGVQDNRAPQIHVLLQK